MPERIGKYQLLRQVATTGSMGQVFKAHDPILDRAVALEVVQPESMVTGDLRARFFREAQACAHLTHPNIVTIYDMGEDNGCLFIAMEFLEGQQLTRIIAERQPLALEDKLAVMMQVCDGLHFAHRRGIVHREITPGNILLQQNGRVKIFGFGIARMSIDPDVARPLVPSDTLHYTSPEQARGLPADQKSDIFSLGVVFYEFLSYRHPFTDEDPTRVLARLQADDPPSLAQTDATIPADLAAIVERMLRKHSEERFANLEQVWSEIEHLQRTLHENAHRLRTQLRGQLDQIFHLQTMLAERIGTLPEGEALPQIDDQGRSAALHAIEQDFAARITSLRDRIARAEALGPAFVRGTELLQTLQFVDAALEFEAIIADMPEHARAQAGLRQARAQAEEQRRWQVAADLLQDARVAVDGGGYALCLKILQNAREVPAPAAMTQELAALERTALAAIEAREAAQRERDAAERAREQWVQTRRDAVDQDAAHYAADAWSEAEARIVEARAHFEDERYAEARGAFQVATTTLRRALDEVRETRARNEALNTQARDEMARCRRAAQAAHAERYASELWHAAEATFEDPRVESGKRPLARDSRTFEAASALYRRAAAAASATRELDRQRADDMRRQALLAQQSASEAGAERETDQAGTQLAEGEAALRQELYAEAIRNFESAHALYEQAMREADESRQRWRLVAEQKRQNMTEARLRASAVGALWSAHGTWSNAEERSAAAEELLTSGAYADAAEEFEQVALLYQRAAETARESGRRREMAHASSRALDTASTTRQIAVEAQAPTYAAALWSEAEARQEVAIMALTRQDHITAQRLFGEAKRLYEGAAEAAAARAATLAAAAPAQPGPADASEAAAQNLALANTTSQNGDVTVVAIPRTPGGQDDGAAATVERLIVKSGANAAPTTTVAERSTAVTVDAATREPSDGSSSPASNDTSRLDPDATLVAVPSNAGHPSAPLRARSGDDTSIMDPDATVVAVPQVRRDHAPHQPESSAESLPDTPDTSTNEPDATMIVLPRAQTQRGNVDDPVHADTGPRSGGRAVVIGIGLLAVLVLIALILWGSG